MIPISCVRAPLLVGPRAFVLVIAALFALSSAGCVKKPFPKDACTHPDLGGCIIEDVDIVGNAQVDSEDLEGAIATAESSRVLGGTLEHVPILGVWDTLTVEYELFDRFVLERDLARIERYYRARGFYEAHARAGRVIRLADKKVRVQIVVDEGPPVDDIRIELVWKGSPPQVGRAFEEKDGAEAIVRAEVQNAKNKLEKKPRFDEADYETTKKSMVDALTRRGFAYGEVTGHVFVDLTTRTATVSLTIEFGPYCHFGEIRIVGLGEVPENKVRDAIGIEPGEAYTSDKLTSADFALADLGVFGSIVITPELSPKDQPKSPVVPIVFSLQVSPLRLIQAGVGGELSGDRSDVHAVARWESKNFFGGLRKVTFEVKPGLAFVPFTITNPVFDYLLPEVKARADFVQPGFIESRTRGIVGGSFSLFQYRSADQCGPSSAPGESKNYVGYREFAGRAGVERPFWNNQHTLGLFGNIQYDTPFSYNLDAPPPGFRSVLIPYAELNAALDLRKDRSNKPDKISPAKGFFLNANVQLSVLGDAKDAKFQPEFRGYLPISRKVTLAAKLTTGFLFPRNYGSALVSQPPGAPVVPPAGASAQDLDAYRAQLADYEQKLAAYDQRLAADLQLLSFRGFFSGGANSNRGYGYRGVGPHSQLNSLFESTTDVNCNIPTGGLTLWESSLELRFPVSGNLNAALFVDGSDVTRTAFKLRLDRPHLSAGLGLRYVTPVGPLRADVGYRIPCLQAIGGDCYSLPADEGQPSTFLGLPIAVSVAIGEAF